MCVLEAHSSSRPFSPPQPYGVHGEGGGALLCSLPSRAARLPRPGAPFWPPDLDVSSTFSVQGTFREAPGAARVEDCQLCRPGAFCGRTGLTEPQGLCSPGHHCGPGSNTSSPVSAGPPGPKGGKAGLSSEAWAGVRGHQYLPLGLMASGGNRAKMVGRCRDRASKTATIKHGQ